MYVFLLRLERAGAAPKGQRNQEVAALFSLLSRTPAKEHCCPASLLLFLLRSGTDGGGRGGELCRAVFTKRETADVTHATSNYKERPSQTPMILYTYPSPSNISLQLPAATKK